MLLCGLLLGRLLAQAQAPSWQLATIAGQVSNGFQTIVASAADASGNVYLVGNFTGTLRFGPISITGASGFDDVFVAKWSSATSSFVWAQRMGGTDIDRATAVAVSGRVRSGGVWKWHGHVWGRYAYQPSRCHHRNQI